MKTPEQVRDEAAADEAVNGYNWASKRKMPESDISYEWGVKAGFKLGYDYAVKHDPRVLALVEALKNLRIGMLMINPRAGQMFPEVTDALKAWEGEP